MTSSQHEGCLAHISGIIKLSFQVRLHKAVASNLVQQLQRLQGPLTQCHLASLRGGNDDRWRSLQPGLEELRRHLSCAEAAMSACCNERVLFKLILGDGLRAELIRVTCGVIAAAAAVRLDDYEETGDSSAAVGEGKRDCLESAGPVWAFKKGYLTRTELISALCEEKLASEDELLHLQVNLEEERQRRVRGASTSAQPQEVTRPGNGQAGSSHFQPSGVRTELSLEEVEGLLEQIRGGVVRLREPVPAAVEVVPIVKVPSSFLCPIAWEIMWDPVMVVESGYTYESEAILNWLKTHNTDPMSGAIISTQEPQGGPHLLGEPQPRGRTGGLVSNRNLRATITTFLSQHEPYSRLPREQWPTARVTIREMEERGGEGNMWHDASVYMPPPPPTEKRRRLQETASLSTPLQGPWACLDRVASGMGGVQEPQLVEFGIWEDEPEPWTAPPRRITRMRRIVQHPHLMF